MKANTHDGGGSPITSKLSEEGDLPPWNEALREWKGRAQRGQHKRRGSLVSVFTLALENAGGNEIEKYQAITDNLGRFQFHHVPPGRYWALAIDQFFRWPNAEFDKRTRLHAPLVAFEQGRRHVIDLALLQGTDIEQMGDDSRE
jgi:hypothetical protein